MGVVNEMVNMHISVPAPVAIQTWEGGSEGGSGGMARLPKMWHLLSVTCH